MSIDRRRPALFQPKADPPPADNGGALFNLYVLKSFKNGKRYVGFTCKSPEERLKEHNSGGNRWTRGNGPFELVYAERFEDKTECIKRENFLKSGQGRKYLDSILKL